MKVSSQSDLGRLSAIQRQASQTRANLDRTGVELASGQKSDLYKATGGNLTRLFSLDRALERNAVYTDTIALTETRLDILQASLASITEPIRQLSTDLKISVGMNDISSSLTHAKTSRARLAEAIGVLNTRVAGQALFAGTATGGNAMAQVTTILADLQTAIGGAVTAEDAIDAVEAYFAPGGPFFGDGYVGADEDLVDVELAEGARYQFTVRADTPEIRALLQGHALAALVAEGAFAGDIPSQLNLLGNAATIMTEGTNQMLALQATVGVNQSTVERAKAERQAERNSLDLARTAMLEADQLEVASRFQALEAQLESVYTVTARLSQLSFVNYMR